MRRSGRKGIVGIEAAIVMIAFVIVASAFAFMVVNMGLTSTQRSKEAIQQGLKEASCPLTLDGSLLLKSDPTEPNNVETIIIPLKTLGVKYVPMWTNETVVSVKIGTKTALANVYAGINHDIDPTGMTLEEIILRLTTVTETITVSGGSGTLTELDGRTIVPGSVTIELLTGTANWDTLKDNGKGELVADSTKYGSIDYDDGTISLTTDGTNSFDGTVKATYRVVVNSVEVVGESDSGIDISSETLYLDHYPVVPGSVSITVTDGTTTGTLTDNGDGTFTISSELTSLITDATIDYTTGEISLSGTVTVNAVSSYEYVVETKAVLVVENDNGDDSLDFFEKGYLIIDLDASQRLEPRDNVLVEIRPEKSAPLTIEFTVPEAIPADAFVTVE